MEKVSFKTTQTNHFQIVTNVMLIAFLSILTFSCTNDDEPPVVVKKEISEEIKDLIYFKGDEKASTVLINVQGGPDTKLDTSLVGSILDNSETKDFLTVNPHQAQTLDSTIVKGNDITLDQAIAFNEESIEILHKVSTYFKKQGRTVYILGNSFGAFMTQELIAKKGIDSADKYLIMTGRLDINAVVWEAMSEGRVGYFENGVTPIIDANPDPDVKERNLNRITAELGSNRYTQEFNSIPDLSKITYVYGATDQAVGGLTSEEVQFLQSKNATVLAGEGNHDVTFFEFIVQGLNDAFGIEIILQN
ncbi:hypothetical protein CLV91_1811 [Maribacter vaceletii]|uniref:Pimeloyl-ACP methyl ester carboxylesterase n=1 Tax=Maribacter vaceletii TaxID=1206816 RepID=A0A495EB33_9FLAO|nr:hypothetical protein [Maribacter vaceletii]RKR13097.1 hypothetical protein CLV91_1811 [Maribacter vaceletii]